MSQHPFPATNVQYSPLLAFMWIIETERKGGWGVVKMVFKGGGGKKVERGINQSRGEKKMAANKNIYKQKELQKNEHALKAKGRSGRTADGELW